MLFKCHSDEVLQGYWPYSAAFVLLKQSKIATRQPKNRNSFIGEHTDFGFSNIIFRLLRSSFSSPWTSNFITSFLMQCTNIDKLRSMFSYA